MRWDGQLLSSSVTRNSSGQFVGQAIFLTFWQLWMPSCRR